MLKTNKNIPLIKPDSKKPVSKKNAVPKPEDKKQTEEIKSTQPQEKEVIKKPAIKKTIPKKELVKKMFGKNIKKPTKKKEEVVETLLKELPIENLSAIETKDIEFVIQEPLIQASIASEVKHKLGDDLDHFKQLREKKLQEEEEKVNTLRQRQKRIVGLIKNKFDLNSIRGDKSNGISVSRIHTSDVVAMWIEFMNIDLAQKATSFLESQNYHVVLHDKKITINLLKTPEEVQFIKHEETSDLIKMSTMVEVLSQTVEKQKTAGLTPDQIGNRIWDYMHNNNLIVFDGNRKFSVQELLSGDLKSAIWDKDTFISLIINEALKH